MWLLNPLVRVLLPGALELILEHNPPTSEEYPHLVVKLPLFVFPF
jgi:hypothetical protein